MAPEKPINLNLALIVHRVLTDPRGWRVDRLKEDLGIADRTYRKYRNILQNDFPPFLQRESGPALVEVDEGPARYLRFDAGNTHGVNDDDFPVRVGAMFMAKVLMRPFHSTEVGHAFEDWCREFAARVRDREFVMEHLLRHADRYFVVAECTRDKLVPSGKLAQILQSLLFHRHLIIRQKGISHEEHVEPLSLAYREGGWWLVYLEKKSVKATPLLLILEAHSAKSRFRYPKLEEYDPSNIDWEEFFKNTEHVERK